MFVKEVDLVQGHGDGRVVEEEEPEEAGAALLGADEDAIRIPAFGQLRIECVFGDLTLLHWRVFPSDTGIRADVIVVGALGVF